MLYSHEHNCARWKKPIFLVQCKDFHLVQNGKKQGHSSFAKWNQPWWCLMFSLQQLCLPLAVRTFMLQTCVDKAHCSMDELFLLKGTSWVFSSHGKIWNSILQLKWKRLCHISSQRMSTANQLKWEWKWLKSYVLQMIRRCEF